MRGQDRDRRGEWGYKEVGEADKARVMLVGFEVAAPEGL